MSIISVSISVIWRQIFENSRACQRCAHSVLGVLYRFGVWILHLFSHACVLEVQRRRVGERASEQAPLSHHTLLGWMQMRALFTAIDPHHRHVYVCNKWWIFHVLGRSSGGGGERETARRINSKSFSTLGRGPFRKKLSPVQYCALAYTDCWRILHVFIWICNSARTQMKQRLQPLLFLALIDRATISFSIAQFPVSFAAPTRTDNMSTTSS